MAGLMHDDALPAGLAEAKRDQFHAEKEKKDDVHHLDSTSSDPSLPKEGRPSTTIDNDDHDDDKEGIYDGLEFPTDQERETLRRVPDTIPWASYLIALVELGERFSYYGSTVVFTNFIQQPLPPHSRTGAGFKSGQSGALGLGQRASTGLTTFNTFWVYIMPLLGAYIADTYWGRYKTICVAVFIALVGHSLLVVSAIPTVISNAHGALACFVIAIIVMGVGTGGFKSNVSPLIAEQYKRKKMFVRTEKDGERVVVDPVLTASRIYMYFYLFINIGALVGQIGMTYSEKYVGFWLSYTLPTLIFLMCPIILYAGKNRYVRSPPQGSVLSKAVHAWRYAARDCWSWNFGEMYRSFRSDGFWERAKPSFVIRQRGEGGKPGWMTYDDQWVEEVRRGFKACEVFLWYPIYWLTYNQINNNLTSQAATMITNGLPNDVLSNLDPLALIILIPICDLLVYPAFRRVGFKFTPLKKITWGFYTGAAAMAWAAVVQHFIYKRNPCGRFVGTCVDAQGNAVTSDLNVWIQTGSYILIAISEILASITGLEYAFTKAPKNMRSLVTSVFLFTSAVSAALGEAFVSLSSDPLLVWNYGSMGVLSFVAGVLFWWCYKGLDKEEDRLNSLGEGNVDVLNEK